MINLQKLAEEVFSQGVDIGYDPGDTDFEKLIPAIESALSRIRQEAFEEAAKVAEAVILLPEGTMYYMDSKDLARNVAQAIRNVGK
jgi:NMD protein affecting ribosome stability and mRNA decay